jgi:hypothetical protein
LIIACTHHFVLFMWLELGIDDCKRWALARDPACQKSASNFIELGIRGDQVTQGVDAIVKFYFLN